MSILRLLIDKIKGSTLSYPKDYWPSVVVLLRMPIHKDASEVLETAQASWGAHAPVEALATTEQGASHVLRSGGMIFSVHFATDQYTELAEDGDEVLTRPWKEHRAWMSVDMPDARCFDLSAKKTLANAYKLLLIYAFKSWSENCLGVYFPAEGVMIPNLGALAESIQWGRKNGLNLAFLN
jgi:hypothetical protein